MTKSQELTIRQSELRETINRLSALEQRTAEQDTELATARTAAQKLEPELREAVKAEAKAADDAAAAAKAAGDDPETRERIELRGRAHLGAFLASALRGRLVSGAEQEYAAACKVPDGEIPLDIFEIDRPAPPEVRDVTPAPTTGTGVNVAPVQPFIFAPSIAPRLGIDMPAVGSGGYSEMTITTALTPMAEGKGDAADGTAGALTAVTATPRRISARLSLSLEDVASVGAGNFEAALRAHVSAALSDAYDDQCINGNGSAPNVNGLINQLNDPTNPTAIAAFDDFVEAFAQQIDGLWAARMMDVSMVANVDAYKLSAQTFRGTPANGGPALTAAAALEQMTGGWWTNKRMPATAATIARAIVYRMGRMGLRTASHPVWQSLAIDDIYSGSASGERHFTMHVLVGSRVIIVQPAAYDLAEFKVA